MNPALTTGAAVLTLAALLALTHVPLGTWIHLVFTDEQDWRVERAVYRLVGVDARTEQRWTGYAVSAVSFAVVSVVPLFLLIRRRAGCRGRWAARWTGTPRSTPPSRS